MNVKRQEEPELTQREMKRKKVERFKNIDSLIGYNKSVM